MMKRTFVIILSFLLTVSLTACGSGSSNTSLSSGSSSSTESNSLTTTASNNNNTATTSESTTASSKEKTFGDIIVFDDLEIVFGNDINWTTVSNQFSDKNGMKAFLVPITIKNTKAETHGLNMFYYSQYGSKGTKLESAGSFFDNEVGSGGDMRSGAVKESVMAFLYDGDGDYYVEFEKPLGDTIEVRLTIVWEDSSASVLSDTPASIVSSTPSVSNNVPSFGDVIKFDDLEMVFGNKITWSTVSNQFSDKNGMAVFLVPVSIKNTKSETHGLNMFYYTQYGSQGTKLESVGSFFDNEIGSTGDMRSGASQEVAMAFLYDGDGDYYIEFKKPFGETIEIRLPVNKSDSYDTYSVGNFSLKYNPERNIAKNESGGVSIEFDDEDAMLIISPVQNPSTTDLSSLLESTIENLNKNIGIADAAEITKYEVVIDGSAGIGMNYSVDDNTDICAIDVIAVNSSQGIYEIIAIQYPERVNYADEIIGIIRSIEFKK